MTIHTSISRLGLLIYRFRRALVANLAYWRSWWHLRLVSLVGRDVKIIIGASTTCLPSWIKTQQYFFDLTREEQMRKFVGNRKATSFLLEHVLEHLNKVEAMQAIQYLMSLTDSKGLVRIAVPDGNHPNNHYIEIVGVGGMDDHKHLWTFDEFLSVARELNLEIHLREYFDGQGMFHSDYADDSNGYISRSQSKSQYREDHAEFGDYGYTSLIVDLKHPFQ